MTQRFILWGKFTECCINFAEVKKRKRRKRERNKQFIGQCYYLTVSANINQYFLELTEGGAGPTLGTLLGRYRDPGLALSWQEDFDPRW